MKSSQLCNCMLRLRPETCCTSLRQAWRAASPWADAGRLSDSSCRNNFLRLGHLIISGAAFPLLSLGTTLTVCQRVHLSPQYVTSASSSYINTPPFTFCSVLVLLDSFSSLSCQETVEAHLTSPRGDVLLFNTSMQISPLSCCRFQGVSSLASVSHLLLREEQRWYLQTFRAFTFDLFGERVPFNQVQCEGENNFHLSRTGGSQSQTRRLIK